MPHPNHPALLAELIAAAENARGEADAGILFASHAGLRLADAAFELFQCDGLYTLMQDVEHELRRGETSDRERKAA